MKKNNKKIILKVIFYIGFFIMFSYAIFSSSIHIDDTVSDKFTISFILTIAMIAIIECLFHYSKIKNKRYGTCSECGYVIKNLNKSCTKHIGKYLGSENKIIYEKVVSETKSTTEHFPGGYAPKSYGGKNKYSETTNRTVTSLPINATVYNYEVEYKCKNCGKLYTVKKEEYKEKIKGK